MAKTWSTCLFKWIQVLLCIALASCTTFKPCSINLDPSSVTFFELPNSITSQRAVKLRSTMITMEELPPAHQHDYYREQDHSREDHHTYDRVSHQGITDHPSQSLIEDGSKWCPQHGALRRDVGDSTGAYMMEPLDAESRHASGQPNQACTCVKKPKRNNTKYRIKLIAGLVLPYFLASLDLTVVATALPFIASHFRE